MLTRAMRSPSLAAAVDQTRRDGRRVGHALPVRPGRPASLQPPAAPVKDARAAAYRVQRDAETAMTASGGETSEPHRLQPPHAARHGGERVRRLVLDVVPLDPHVA